jgi:hypothetical protein
MLNDPGFLSLVLIFAFWVGLIFVGLATMIRPRNWKRSEAGKKVKPSGTYLSNH